jgi:hypothetical protein
MTVRDWIARRVPRPPAALTERVLTLLGADANRDGASTADVCLAAAARVLDDLIAAERFGRESALDLLAVDALTTWAFEHASGAKSDRDLLAFSQQGARVLGRLATQRV